MAQDNEESLFIPSSDIERRYKEQFKILLESNGAKSALIDMGHLPVIYTAFGIKDKVLKTNGKTLLKALGIEGKNKHNVPKETIENLLSLTYDPEAVFKSLSTSDNPNSYVAVLNAKAFNQKQIIAILSPSRDGQGFTFIPSVYERNRFEQFIMQTYSENRILYIKNKGSRLWGQLQSLPRHNQEPSIKNILTKNDIVKRFNKNILNKEKTMANEFQGIWIKDDKVPFYRETLKESIWEPTFNNSEFTFILSRRGLNKNDDPLLLSIHEGFENKAGDDSLTFRFEGDIPAAKKAISDVIKIFNFKRTTDQKVTIYQFKDFFSS